MRPFTLLLVLSFFFYSCNNDSSTTQDFKYSKTALGTLKEKLKTDLSNPYYYTAEANYLKKHKDEVLKTVEVVEEVEVQKDVMLVFYRFSIGADIAKEIIYMRKVDGLYYPYSKYFSQYSEDPFDNGKPEEAKALLTKADDWAKNENVWWAN